MITARVVSVLKTRGASKGSLCRVSAASREAQAAAVRTSSGCDGLHGRSASKRYSSTSMKGRLSCSKSVPLAGAAGSLLTPLRSVKIFLFVSRIPEHV